MRHGRINGNLNISRAFGDLRFKADPSLLPTEQLVTVNPDILERRLRQDDEFLILACDGIWDCVTDQECVDWLRRSMLESEGGDLEAGLASLLDHCLAPDPPWTVKGMKGGDNMTCLVVVFRGDQAGDSDDDGYLSDY